MELHHQINMNNLIQKAILFAMSVHHGEVRKGDGKTPYVLHPLEVGIILSYYTSNENLIAAAILHDVLETGKVKPAELVEQFGEEVANIVTALTEDKSIKDWAKRKGEHLERLKGFSVAYIVKAVDALANMRDLCAAVVTLGGKVWKQFNAPKEMELAYFKRILDDIKPEMPSHLLERYVTAFKDLEYSHLMAGGNAVIGFQA